MRALVVYTPERPVDVLHVPESTSVLELHMATQRLDAAGVEYELLPMTVNVTTDDLLSDVCRFSDHDAIEATSLDLEDEYDECGEPSAAHADHCSVHPDNCV